MKKNAILRQFLVPVITIIVILAVLIIAILGVVFGFTGSALQPLFYAIPAVAAVTAAAIVAAVLLLHARVRQITEPLTDLAEIIEQTSEGDFSLRAPQPEEAAEIDQVAGSFNHLTGKVGRVLSETIRLVEDVRGSSNEISDVILESEQSSQDIRSISDCASSQTAEAERASGLAGDFDACTARLADMAERLAAQSDEIRNLGKAGGASISALEETGRENLAAISCAFDRVGELSASSARIGEIVDEISRISSRTSVLALNASIEAARAGEAGKGFAVVAQEVSKLSMNSADATGSIREIIAGLQEQIGGIVDLITRMRETITVQTDAADAASGSMERLERMCGESEQTAREMFRLTGSAGDIGREITGITADIHELSAETERTAQETAKRVARQAETVRSLAQKVENMNAASDILELEMQRFRI